MQRWAGFDAELADQPLAGLLVGRQRLGLATRPVQRQHQQLPEALVERVLLHQPPQLDHQLGVLTQPQPRVHQRLQRLHALLVQGRDLGLHGPVQLQVAKRPPPPQRRGLRQLPSRAGKITPPVRRGPPIHQPPPAQQVQPLRIDLEPVAARLGQQPRPRGGPGGPRAQQPTHRAGIGAQVGDGRRRRLGLPEGVHQGLVGHGRVGLQQQHGQQRPLLGGADPDGLTVLGPDLERSKDQKLHGRPPDRRLPTPPIIPSLADRVEHRSRTPTPDTTCQAAQRPIGATGDCSGPVLPMYPRHLPYRAAKGGDGP